MTQTLTTELLSVARAMRDYIDALPADVVASLPTMPGFDRDWADEVMDGANREAQPVMYASEETLAYAKEGEKSLVTWSEPMGDAVIPLYTTQPAPAVVKLPTEFYSDEGMMVQLEKVMSALAVVGVKYERKGDDCAAMLAQPVSQRYKLPDGWTLVPIDATRAMIDAAQRVEENGYDAMHKAMLAAVPESGN